jgi:hypothetical protein
MSSFRDHHEQLSAQDREQAKSSTRYNRHVNAALRLLSEHARTATKVVNQQQFLRAQQQVGGRPDSKRLTTATPHVVSIPLL